MSTQQAVGYLHALGLRVLLVRAGISGKDFLHDREDQYAGKYPKARAQGWVTRRIFRRKTNIMEMISQLGFPRNSP